MKLAKLSNITLLVSQRTFQNGRCFQPCFAISMKTSRNFFYKSNKNRSYYSFESYKNDKVTAIFLTKHVVRKYKLL